MFGASGKKPSKLLAIDWDAHNLRLAHVRLTKRGVKIERLMSVRIPDRVDTNVPDQMGGYIRRALDQEGITTRHTMVDIPRDQAILNTLRLPAGVPDELPGMVRIQITKELPFPIGDAVIDFAVGEQIEQTAIAEVLVAAVRHEVLQQYVNTIEAAGLKLDHIGLRPHASKVAVCELLRHAMPERVLFIDVRPTQTEIDVLRRSSLVFSRSAEVSLIGRETHPADLDESRAADAHEFGSQSLHLASPEPARQPAPQVQSLVLEVARSIEAYRASDPGAKFDHVVVGGDVGIEEQLADLLQKRLGATAELYNPASSFGWDPDQGAGASAFCATLGLALSYATDHPQGFDFLHPKHTVTKTQKRLRKAPAIAAVIVVFVLAGFLAVAQATKGDRQRLARIGRRMEELRGEKRANEKFLKLVNRVRAFDTQQIWVDLAYDIFLTLPSNKDLVVDHVAMNQSDNRVILKTRAKRRDVASQAIASLNSYQREEDGPKCFRAIMRTQTESPKDRYPFSQDIVVYVLTNGVYGADALRTAEMSEKPSQNSVVEEIGSGDVSAEHSPKKR